MKKLFLTVSALCLAVTAMAEAQKLTMTTSKAVGTELTFLVNATRSGVTVDWGDGAVQTYTAEKNSGVLEVKGTVKGGTIVLTAPKYLTLFAAENAGLTSVDLSEASELVSLYLQHNDIETLNVANMAVLRDLKVCDNQLQSITLNASKNPLLENIDLSDNPMTATSFNYSTSNLRYLNLGGLNYSSVSLTKAANLDALIMPQNKVKTLTLTAMGKVSLIDVRGNEISTVKYPSTGLPELQQLCMDDNEVKTLDVSASEKLNTLTLARNGASQVVLPTKSTLQVYDCSENSLTFSSLPRKSYKPSVYLAYSPQNPHDISGYGLNEPFPGGLPWLTMNPDYASRGDAQYQLDMSDHVGGSGSSSVVFELVSVGKDGEQVLEKASATNKTLDYSNVSGKITVLKPYMDLYLRLTDAGYPDLTVTTTHFSVIDPTSGIQQIETDDDLNDAPAYDLQGRRIQAATAKGLYILGGKKVIKK